MIGNWESGLGLVLDIRIGNLESGFELGDWDKRWNWDWGFGLVSGIRD